MSSEIKREPVDSDESDDDIPISALLVKIANKQKKVESESEDEENLTVSELVKRKMTETSKSSKELEKAKQTKIQPPKSKSTSSSTSASTRSTTTSSTSSSNKASRQSGSYNNKSIAFYETKKGDLVQTLLVRWWYAYDWPLPSEIGVPPPGFEKLEGFPGVFVSTRSDSLGKILDLRDKTNCPSLARFSKKPSSELQELCIRALTNQIEALTEAEGEDSRLIESLKKRLREVKGVNPEKADREAIRFNDTF